MIDIPTGLTVKKVPHVFSRVDVATREKYIERYKIAKKSGIAVSFGVVTISGAISLSKDLAVSKLKAFGYKRLFVLLAGPVIQFIGLPIYILSYGLFFRKYAKIIIEFGASITRGEFEIANLLWIISDFALFGEPILVTDDASFKLILNETESTIINLFNESFTD